MLNRCCPFRRRGKPPPCKEEEHSLRKREDPSVDKINRGGFKGRAGEYKVVQQQPEPLFWQIGGLLTLEDAVEEFYDRMLSDPRLKHFFAGLDMQKQMAKMFCFMAYAFGGADGFPGRNLREAHSRLILYEGLKVSHFDMVLQHLEDSLHFLGLREELVLEVVAKVEGTRDMIFGPFEDEEVVEGAAGGGPAGGGRDGSHGAGGGGRDDRGGGGDTDAGGLEQRQDSHCSSTAGVQASETSGSAPAAGAGCPAAHAVAGLKGAAAAASAGPTAASCPMASARPAAPPSTAAPGAPAPHPAASCPVASSSCPMLATGNRAPGSGKQPGSAPGGAAAPEFDWDDHLQRLANMYAADPRLELSLVSPKDRPANKLMWRTKPSRKLRRLNDQAASC